MPTTLRQDLSENSEGLMMNSLSDGPIGAHVTSGGTTRRFVLKQFSLLLCWGPLWSSVLHISNGPRSGSCSTSCWELGPTTSRNSEKVNSGFSWLVWQSWPMAKKSQEDDTIWRSHFRFQKGGQWQHHGIRHSRHPCGMSTASLEDPRWGKPYDTTVVIGAMGSLSLGTPWRFNHGTARYWNSQMTVIWYHLLAWTCLEIA